MGVYEGRGQLAKGIKELLHRWSEARMSWDDPVSRAFEKDHLLPLELDLKSAVSAMEHIATVISQVKRDCGE